jgi:putative ABC transport system ATP-binding protein
MDFITFNDVYKTYHVNDLEIHAACGVSFSIHEGEFCVLLGASGAGKSTVLNILGGIDTATSGEAWVNGTDLLTLNKRQMTKYRREQVGFVFQFYNLIPNLTAIENIALAQQVCKNPLDAEEILDAVGLAGRNHNFPSQLSGWEQQRVSIARALAKNPAVLLCDEPTGALDYKTGKMVLSLLFEMSRKLNRTIVLVTHNSALADMGDKVIRMKNGQVESVKINETPMSVEQIEW